MNFKKKIIGISLVMAMLFSSTVFAMDNTVQMKDTGFSTTEVIGTIDAKVIVEDESLPGEVIPTTPDTNQPNKDTSVKNPFTGDSSLNIFFMLLIIAISTLVILEYRYKKTNNKTKHSIIELEGDAIC